MAEQNVDTTVDAARLEARATKLDLGQHSIYPHADAWRLSVDAEPPCG